EAVEGRIDAAVLSNAVVILRFRIIPPRRKLHKALRIRCITINLIGTHENEWRLGTVPASCLQECQRSDRVDIEIVERPLLREVVRRLGGAVNNQVRSTTLDEAKDRLTVANVQIIRGEMPCRFS